MKKISIFLLALVAGAGTMFASDTSVDGIWYNFDDGNLTAEVTFQGSSYSIYSDEYTGDVVIPASVTYNNEEYSVTSIGEYAFYICSGLTSVTIPNSVTSIGKSAFEGCSDLTSVTIGNSVTSIGDWAFYGCTGLTSVHISDLAAWCAISFGDYSANPLYYAHNLYLNNELITNLVIPDNVTSIGDWTFQNCSGLTSVTIPNSVTSIGNFAFGGCSSLTSVTIPESVTSIGNGAFYGCSNLTSVTNYATTPQTIDSFVFYDVDKSTCVLNVLKESVDLYKAAEGWKEFENIVGADAPQGVEKVLSDKVKCSKLIKNGNVYILTDDKTYTITGQQVK